MCILFINVGDEEGDYSLILASNRDEYYDRPAQEMASWVEDPLVFGGRDLQVAAGGGTWLALSATRKKIGILLNLPGKVLENAQSRGKIVADYVKGEENTKEYVGSLRNYAKECKDFVFVSAEFGKVSGKFLPKIFTYNNATDNLIIHKDYYLGFGNCLPDDPLRKVESGKNKLVDICSRLNKIGKQKQLIEELLSLLKSEERHLPDPQLKKKSPKGYKYLSSIFVAVPESRYGTRTHTLVLVTKTGHMNVVEVNLQSPVDPTKPNWKTTEYQLDMC